MTPLRHYAPGLSHTMSRHGPLLSSISAVGCSPHWMHHNHLTWCLQLLWQLLPKSRPPSDLLNLWALVLLATLFVLFILLIFTVLFKPQTKPVEKKKITRPNNYLIGLNLLLTKEPWPKGQSQVPNSVVCLLMASSAECCI